MSLNYFVVVGENSDEVRSIWIKKDLQKSEVKRAWVKSDFFKWSKKYMSQKWLSKIEVKSTWVKNDLQKVK